MSLDESFKISTKNPQLYLKVYKGHFATSHSHINYYIDVTDQQTKVQEAQALAAELAATYKSSALIDTILCLDGTEVIGAFLARELAKNDYTNLNAGSDIAVLTPEYTSGSQLFFRDNIIPMIENRRVLILAISVVTGYTAKSAAEAIRYYGGTVAGVAGIFASVATCEGVPVVSVFNPKNLPEYQSFAPQECPFCKAGWKIEALVNNHGCSKL